MSATQLDFELPGTLCVIQNIVNGKAPNEFPDFQRSKESVRHLYKILLFFSELVSLIILINESVKLFDFSEDYTWNAICVLYRKNKR